MACTRQSSVAALMAPLETVAPVMESTFTDWFSIIAGIRFSMAVFRIIAVSPLSPTSMEAIFPPSMTVFTFIW